jgi:hypothetical protein
VDLLKEGILPSLTAAAYCSVLVTNIESIADIRMWLDKTLYGCGTYLLTQPADWLGNNVALLMAAAWRLFMSPIYEARARKRSLETGYGKSMWTLMAQYLWRERACRK